MTAEIPTDFAPFIARMIAERRYLSPEDVLAGSLRLLQARESLRREVQMGFDELGAGLGINADDVYRSADENIRRIAAQKGVSV